MRVDERKNLIKERLEKKIKAELSPADQIPVIYPRILEAYKPNHAVGEYLIIFAGSKYGRSEVANNIKQNRDTTISVISAIKKLDNGKSPEYYVDFAVKSITGLEIITARAAKKIFPVSDRFIKEEEGYWWYATDFIVPDDNQESTA